MNYLLETQDSEWRRREAARSLSRLLPRLEERFADTVDTPDWEVFTHRLQGHFEYLFGVLHRLYGERYDFFYFLEKILITITGMWLERAPEMRALDASRGADPQWFQSHNVVGGMLYVDLFSGDLKGLRERIPYLAELGINYLHLMPLFASPADEDDGGYAISSYRQIQDKIGTIDELKALITELRHNGISTVVDFIFNHTADEHDWARQALAGNQSYQEFYRMFPDRHWPDIYEKTIRPVFPEEHEGCFTYRSKIGKWVWTTFHNYQWDLNYENPEVFNAMAGEMLFLANLGVEVLRLDAVAFTWKKPGTDCENLEEAHLLIQAFNAVLRIVAPSMLFKSEAIVHPDEVIKYIAPEECQISYNPQLMALLWDALATRDTRLLRWASEKRFALPDDCAWVNFVRCHDDIGWVFSDDDARQLSIDPVAHRQFLSQFYRGRFKGSFARGEPFQENPATGDVRISGTCASLAGLEVALEADDPELIDHAIKRILLIHGVIMTIGGIPLIYLGDELGMLNDYAYDQDPEKTGDNRWLHRPNFDWDLAENRHDPDTVAGRIFHGFQKLIRIRRQNLAFTRSDTKLVDTENDHVFAYFRQHDDQSVLVLANFAESEQVLSGTRLRTLGLSKFMTDIVAGTTVIATRHLTLAPYQFMVLLSQD